MYITVVVNWSKLFSNRVQLHQYDNKHGGIHHIESGIRNQESGIIYSWTKTQLTKVRYEYILAIHKGLSYHHFNVEIIMLIYTYITQSTYFTP